MTDPAVWLNGRILPVGEAQVPVSDWGFLYGDSVFETLAIHDGRPVAWSEHARRLARSAHYVSMPFTLDPAELRSALEAICARNGVTHGVGRVTVTRGSNPSGLDPRGCVDPTVLVTARSALPPDEAAYRRGIALRMVRVACRKGSTRFLAKTGNYLENLLALREALMAGDDEAMLVDVRRRVLEGAKANLFFVMRGRLVTAPTRLGILPGIVRAWALGAARSAGVRVKVEPITVRSAQAATEAFATNSLLGVMPVRSIDGRRIPDVPGETTTLLMERYRRFVERSIGS